MKISITKKGKIVLFVILGIIVLGSGGYLLWRVLQPETVSPTESDAGGGAGACCIPSIGCVAGYTCKNTGVCSSSESAISYSTCEGLNTVDGFQCCGDGYRCRNLPEASSTCINPSTHTCSVTSQYTCIADSPNEPPTEGDCKDVKCEWPEVLMSGRNDPNDEICRCEVCTGVDPNDAYSCSGNPPTCNPPSCPSGYESCGTSDSHESGSDCVRKSTLSCVVHHEDCNNPSYVYRYCKPVSTEENICEGSSWIEQPSGTHTTCEGIIASVDATDPDGIGTNVSVKVNGQSKTGYTTGSTTSGTSITYEFSESDCTELGEYTISFSWDDGKGNSGDDCTLSTSFTIAEEEPTCGDGILVDGEECELGNPTGYTCTWDTCNQTTCLCEEQQNPDWTISKTGAEQCIEEGEETYAKATYSITVTNVGEGEGTLDKIVDQLDDKVLESYLNDISENGLYDSGTITWDLEGNDEIFSPDESLTLTYYIKVPADSFGIYQNTATAYPTEGDEFSDDESVNLTCDIPQTGIFDSILIKISLGALLILLGANWSKINYSVNESISNTRIKKFERKVAKEK